MRHDGVEFQFYGPEQDSRLTGEVLLRAVDGREQMVISINDPDGESPYLLHGQKSPLGPYFVATNTARQRTTTTHASWVDLGGAYVGRWIEDGVEYLFRFRLPEEKDAK